MSVVRTTLSEQVAAELLAQIERTGLRSGDPIPSEAELSEEFGVNRLVVREAIRMLTAREMLVSSQGRPARVSTPSAHVLAQMLDFRVRQRSLEIGDILDTRRLVEGELARLAARRVGRGDADGAAASEILRRLEDVGGDRDSFVELDVRFHAAVGEMAGADLLQLILVSFETVLLRTRRETYDARESRGEGHESTMVAHRAILGAILDGDEEAAARAMDAHLDETRRDAVGDVRQRPGSTTPREHAEQ